MANKAIIEHINNGIFDNVFQDTKKYLSTLIENGVIRSKDGDLRKKGMFTVQVLHSVVAISESKPLSSEIVSAVHLCCEGYRATQDHVKLQDELTVPKLVYHIINKLRDKEFLGDLHQLGTFLYLSLKDQSVQSCPGIKPIVMSSYSRLWNTSIKHESSSQDLPNVLLTSNICFLSLQFLFKKEKIEDSDVEKIDIVIARYVTSATKLKVQKINQQANLSIILKVYVSVWLDVLEIDHDRFCLMMMKSLVHTLKYLAMYKLLSDVDILISEVKKLGNVSENNSSVAELGNMIVPIITVISRTDKLLQETDLSGPDFENIADDLNSANELLMKVMDERDCHEKQLSVVYELCQVFLVKFKSVPLNQLLSASLINAVRMTLTLYLNCLESEWRKIEGEESSASGLKRHQIERDMLDTFHVKFQMIYRLVQAASDQSELESSLEDCLEAAGLYLNVLEVVESEKTRFDDKYYFGYLMIKFGHYCYNNNLNKLATSFYQHTCRQLTEWCFSEEDKVQARIEELALWKFYNCLAECYRRQGMWQESMETVATYLHIDKDHMSNLIQLWVRIKRDAAREGNSDFMMKTLKDVFEGADESRQPDSNVMQGLLQTELDALHGIKKRWSEGEAVVLSDLVTLSCDPQKRGSYLLSLAQILWITGMDLERSPKQCLDDVFELMTSSSSTEMSLTKAQAYIWRFVMNRDDLCKQFLLPVSSNDAAAADDELDVDVKGKEAMDKPSKVYTLHQAESDLADMETALQLMVQALNGHAFDANEAEKRTLSQNLMLAASVFRLIRKPASELQCLCLALRVCSSSDASTVSQLKLNISRVLVEYGQYNLAKTVVDTDSKQQADDAFNSVLQSLLKERINLHIHEIETGVNNTLEIVEEIVDANNKTWTSTLTEGVAKRLLSMFLVQPLAPNSRVTEYAVSLAQEAVKLHSAVVYFLLGKDFLSVGNQTGRDPHVVDRWLVVCELLESILHVARLFRHVGDAKDARVYLKEGVKISKSLCLPRWTAEFLLELGRICSISNTDEECIQLLTEASVILRSAPESKNVDEIKEEKTKKGSKSVPNGRKPRARAKTTSSSKAKKAAVAADPVDDWFGFESIRDAGIQRPSDSDVTSVTATMSPLPLGFDVPDFSSHSSSCNCKTCQDIIIQELELRFSETLGEFYQYSGLLEKGWEELKKIESSKPSLDQLTQAETSSVHEMLKSADLLPVSGRKNKENHLTPIVLPSIRQLNIESYCLLTQTALKKNESDSAISLAESALRLVDGSSSQDLLLQSCLKAQLQLQQIQAKIQSSGDVFESQDTQVCAKPTANRGRSRGAIQKKNTRRKNTVKAETEVSSNTDLSVIDTLQMAFHNIHHFPSTEVYGDVCRMLAHQHLPSDQLKTAYYLNEAVSITFRHQALAITSKKIRKLQKEMSGCGDGDISGLEQELADLQNVRQLLSFNKEVPHFQQMVRHIPPDWIVCQITMLKNPDESARLLLTRLSCHHDPITVDLPGFQSVQGRNVLPEFKAIMKTSRESMKLTEKNTWWQTRRDLNDRVQSVVEWMEKFWLGIWACLVQGQVMLGERSRTNEMVKQMQKDIKKTCKLSVELSLLELLVNLCLTLSQDDQQQVVAKLLTLDVDSDMADRVTSVISKTCQSAVGESEPPPRRLPVLLVLDKDIQHLPWESMPCLRHQPVTRIPSLYHLHTQLSAGQISESHACVQGVNLENTFYILNPDKDLMSTQESFERIFTSQPGWSGLVGEKPSCDQFQSALTDHDLFIYCGHGSGGKYFSGYDLQHLRCHAVAVLMGCSSGHLQTKGILEPTGMINNYFLAGCPTIIANLWDVTDRDIDRFLESILNSWLSSDGEGSLLDPIPAARDICRLPFLIGAAPVVYGFPVCFR